MQKLIMTEPIWPCIQLTLDFLSEQRKSSLPQYVESGMNFSIILGAACYVEGVLESFLRALLSHRRWEHSRVTISDFEFRLASNTYFNRIEEDLSERIKRANGASGYDEAFEVLCGKRLSQLAEVKTLWEGTTVLFQFRNALGHGREVSARQFRGAAVDGGFREDFSGSYRKVEDYLFKKGLLSSRFVDMASQYIFLTSPIADHFWTLAKGLPETITQSLSVPEGEACRQMLRETADHYGTTF